MRSRLGAQCQTRGARCWRDPRPRRGPRPQNPLGASPCSSATLAHQLPRDLAEGKLPRRPGLNPPSRGRWWAFENGSPGLPGDPPHTQTRAHTAPPEPLPHTVHHPRPSAQVMPGDRDRLGALGACPAGMRAALPAPSLHLRCPPSRLPQPRPSARSALLGRTACPAWQPRLAAPPLGRSTAAIGLTPLIFNRSCLLRGPRDGFPPGEVSSQKIKVIYDAWRILTEPVGAGVLRDARRGWGEVPGAGGRTPRATQTSRGPQPQADADPTPA